VPLFFEVLDVLVPLSINNALEHDNIIMEDLVLSAIHRAEKKPSSVIRLLRSVPKC
jgi:hypothetical protein